MAGAFARDRRSVARLAVACLGLAVLALGASGGLGPRVSQQVPAKLHAPAFPLPALRSEPGPIHAGMPRIALGPGGQDVRFAGELTEGAAERLRAILEAHPAVTRIHLTSEGGLVEEGAAIGALIAAHGLDAYVPDYCVSACTLAFVRGAQRFIRPESRLGFHAPYEDGPMGDAVPVDASDERAAYLAAGLDGDFVARALAVPSHDIWIPGTDRLLESGVATARVDAHRFPDSTLDAAPDLAGARSAILTGIEGARALEGSERLDALAARYLAAYRAARSEGEISAELHRLVTEAHTSRTDLTR